MENAGYMLSAFIIIWAALLGYVFMLSRRQAKIHRDIELLKENISQQG